MNHSLCRFLCLLALGMASVAQAQVPTANLTSLFPPGGRAGANIDVVVTGANLEDGERLLFSHPGITGVPKMQPADEFVTEARPIDFTYVVTIAADVPPGIYEVRQIGLYGASNPRQFAVGSFEEAVRKGDNTQKDRAQDVSIPMTVSGRVASNQIDYYALNLQEGQHVTFDCLAQRIDSRMNATLVLYDPQDRELSRALDTEGLDPVMEFPVPRTGRYVLAVYDFVYGGGNDHFYRLNIHAGPHIDFVFPPAIAAQGSSTVTLFGRNLPGGEPVPGLRWQGSSLHKLDVSLSPPAAIGATITGAAPLRTLFADQFEYRLTTPQGVSNAVAIGIASQLATREAEPNDMPHAQRVSLPCEIAGQFFPERDTDWYQFNAKQGETWVVELLSHQLGRNTDPVLLVQQVTLTPNGEEQVREVAFVDDAPDRGGRIGDEFDTSHDDPLYTLQVPQDGLYRVMVRDQLGDGRADPRALYRLEIHPPRPDYRIAVFPDQPSAGKQANEISVDTVDLLPGGTALLRVKLDRRDGLLGDVEIKVEGLPSGVNAAPVLLSGSQETAILTLTTDDNAAPWVGSLRVMGQATINNQPVVRAATAGTCLWGVANKQSEVARYRVLRSLVLNVHGSTPEAITLKLGDGSLLETALGGKLEIPVQAVRRRELKDPVKITLLGAPKDAKAKDLSLAGGANEGKLELDLSNVNLKPGAFTFGVRGESKLSYQRPSATQPRLEADLKQIDERLKQLASMKDALAKTITPDNKAQVEQQLKEFEEKIKQGNERRQQTEQRLNELKKNLQPKDVAVAYLSNAVRVRLHESPLKLETPTPLATIKTGQKQTATVRVTRLFNFNDPVEVILEPPANVPTLAAKGTLAAGQSAIDLECNVDKNVASGDYAGTLKLKGKFGNRNFETSSVITLKIEASP